MDCDPKARNFLKYVFYCCCHLKARRRKWIEWFLISNLAWFNLATFFSSMSMICKTQCFMLGWIHRGQEHTWLQLTAAEHLLGKSIHPHILTEIILGRLLHSKIAIYIPENCDKNRQVAHSPEHLFILILQQGILWIEKFQGGKVIQTQQYSLHLSFQVNNINFYCKLLRYIKQTLTLINKL